MAQQARDVHDAKDVNEQLCFNDWTVKVCEELARFSLTAEQLVPWGFPWSLWWTRGVVPVTAAWDAANLSNNYRPDSQPMVDLRRGWRHARKEQLA